MATSIQPEYLKVRVMPLKPSNDGGKPLWLPGDLDVDVSTKNNIHQLGKNLFVILLEVIPSNDGIFLTEKLYGYDIIFKFKPEVIVIDDKTVLSKKESESEISFATFYNKNSNYSYAGLEFPVFVIPDQNKPNSRILYGSCRKTHGPGSDALNAADALLEESWTAYAKNSKLRIPDFSLFHLGDQIYADDLHEEVFNAVRELSLWLMGYDETIPEYKDIEEITIEDLKKFLENYLQGAKHYDPQDGKYKDYDLNELNTLTHINYNNSDKRKNVILFLKEYYSTNYELRKEIKSVINVGATSFLQGKWTVSTLIDFLDGRAGNLRSLSLIDLNEILPRAYLLKDLETIKTKVYERGFNERKGFVRKNSSISSIDESHLLTFGEFAALYIIHWSDMDFVKELTPESIKKNKYFQDFKRNSLLPGTTQYAIDEAYKMEKGANLEGIISGNKKIKRLFANVPSYMIFDDHDVTDDWNCDEVWRYRVENSKTGKRMVSNALAAYWAFQGWGNDPDTFAGDKSGGKLVNAITEYLQHPLGDQWWQDDSEKAKKYEDALWGFDDWAFIAPTNPIAVFLDNRTMRHGKEEMNYSPQYENNNNTKKIKAVRLMSPKAFEKIESLLKSSNYQKDTPIIFCAPAPIIGWGFSRKLQLLFVDGSFNKKFTVVTKGKFRKPGRYEHDWEQWCNSPRGKYEFFNFIDLKIQPSHIFILSGEVHYGFRAAVNIYSELTKRNYEIQQLTSSALKNNTLDTQGKINHLAYFTFIDTKDAEYKNIDESYPFPDSPSNTPFHFKLNGKLIKYSHIIDKDSWVIPYNNIGLVEFRKMDRLYCLNLFLYSAYYNAPIIKSKSIS